MRFLPVLFLFLTVSARAQQPDSLAQAVTRHAETEREKVEAIFQWITQNIAYALPGGRKDYPVLTDEPVLDTSHDGREGLRFTARQVLLRREAVCEGYARLFKVLCAAVGVQAEIVSGYVRTGSAKKFGSNHSWNAVRIDSTWYLADPTWASGFISMASGRFVNAYDPFYFLTPPDQLARTHFPDDPRWLLLPSVARFPEFRRQPFRQKAFIKYSLLPDPGVSGWITARSGDTLTLRLRSVDPDRDRQVAIDLMAESTPSGSRPDWVLLEGAQEGDAWVYRYVPQTTGQAYLFLRYRGEPVLRYFLQVEER